MIQLINYVIALSNLYGMVHKDKVLEIYNSQNEDQISPADVQALIGNPPQELTDAFVLTHNDYFIKESILEYNEFDLMFRKKIGKPYYVPAKDELLNYVDEFYFEKSKQYNDLLTYLEKNFFEPGDEKAENLAENIQGMCQFDVNISQIFDLFNEMKLSFHNMDQTNKAMQLVMELSNNTRIWENNGHTPNEIFEKLEKPHLRPLPNKPFEFGESQLTDRKIKQKIGRNDPCPCGSGKKYKKCCMGKDD